MCEYVWVPMLKQLAQTTSWEVSELGGPQGCHDAPSSPYSRQPFCSEQTRKTQTKKSRAVPRLPPA